MKFKERVKEKKNPWDNDTLVRVSKDTRRKLKIKALEQGLSLKDYLEYIAKSEEI